jgi:hypothetical protein
MNTRFHSFLLILVLSATTALGAPLGTAITVEGKVNLNGQPANGSYDMTFQLFDALTGGNRAGAAATASRVQVTAGEFTRTIDFGVGAFNGDARWLEMTVKPAGSLTTPTILYPRTPMAPVPYALFAANGPVGPQGPTGPQGPAGPPGPVSDQAWLVTGNTITLHHFLGTLNNHPIRFRVNNTLRARLESDGFGILNNSGNDLIKLLINPGPSGEADASGDLLLNYWTGANSVRLRADGSAGGGPSLQMVRPDGMESILMDAPETGANLLLRKGANNGSPGVILNADRGSLEYGASVRLYHSSDQARLRESQLHVTLHTTVDGAHETLFDSQGDPMVTLEANRNTGILYLSNEDNHDTVVLSSNGGGTKAGFLSLRNLDGNSSLTLWGRATNDKALLECKGVVRTEILEITGGADLSEKFDINSARVLVEPGMLVCIDAENPGRLIPSHRAHDKTVAGIISGAGGVSPGMLMGQAGTLANGAQPVALTGRVYALCDASFGSVEPGDLLTTSDTPGHAMKVSDHSGAQGSIVGKAMTRLENGKGLVLVLVTLQ